MSEFKIQIDIDDDKSNRLFSKREKLGIWILWLLFKITFPMKYPHQAHVLDELFFKKLGE